MEKTTISETAALPVSTVQLRDWCRVDDKQDEETFYALALAATQLIEKQTGRALAPKTIEYGFEACEGPRFTIPTAPVREIIEVAFRDEFGAETPIDEAEYTVSSNDTSTKVLLAGSLSLPQGSSLVVTADIGYDANDPNSPVIPAPLKHALVVWVAAHYNNREGQVEKAEAACTNLIAPYRLNLL